MLPYLPLPFYECDELDCIKYNNIVEANQVFQSINLSWFLQICPQTFFGGSSLYLRSHRRHCFQ